MTTPASRNASTAASRRFAPKVHGGILANRLLPEHMTAVEGAGIRLIDLVVVNLYPFRETVAKPGCTLEDAIENIDIGGPTMACAAAKNWEGVAIVVDSGDYAALADEIRANAGTLSRKTRFALAKSVYAHRRIRRRNWQLPDLP